MLELEPTMGGEALEILELEPEMGNGALELFELGTALLLLLASLAACASDFKPCNDP